MNEESIDRAVPMEEGSTHTVIDFASMGECTATQLINDGAHHERLKSADRGSLLSESDHVVMRRVSDFVRDAWSMSDEALMDVMAQIKDGKIDQPGNTKGRGKASLGPREPWYVNWTLERDDFENSALKASVYLMPDPLYVPSSNGVGVLLREFYVIKHEQHDEYVRVTLLRHTYMPGKYMVDVLAELQEVSKIDIERNEDGGKRRRATKQNQVHEHQWIPAALIVCAISVAIRFEKALAALTGNQQIVPVFIDTWSVNTGLLGMIQHAMRANTPGGSHMNIQFTGFLVYSAEPMGVAVKITRFEGDGYTLDQRGGHSSFVAMDLMTVMQAGGMTQEDMGRLAVHVHAHGANSPFVSSYRNKYARLDTCRGTITYMHQSDVPSDRVPINGI